MTNLPLASCHLPLKVPCRSTILRLPSLLISPIIGGGIVMGGVFVVYAVYGIAAGQRLQRPFPFNRNSGNIARAATHQRNNYDR
jgi:hypothetical protein